ncbi:hypothetical protein [Micromonospora endolithica]|uniref:Uncharacterized protein n=1 Tax=Micromonospora endolithica TaxID=230091 RepID=A0A3A9ZHB1_9ACTN|nr:hypothetical protein [Micromonospora endolithica]RKN47892.1 hypothetical protein D7223_14295 [Micromonospora endolithica]TWJ21594.1 hypothetical protein JD76_01704 [Micromonospora endolithica]
MTTATWRLAHQTARWCRFAVVTVDVAPAPRPEVRVTGVVAGMRDERREVELGARAALRRLAGAGPFVVTVTGIRATVVDTGVGDLHEAAARAVWQAAGGVAERLRYAGFGEPELVAAWLRDRLGLRVESVTEARPQRPGARDVDPVGPVHAWLHPAGRPPTRLDPRGGELLLRTGDPYPSYRTGEGVVRVGPAGPPDPLADLVGERLTGGAVLVAPATGACAGLLLRAGAREVLVAAAGDRWVLARDPAPSAVAATWQVRGLDSFG